MKTEVVIQLDRRIQTALESSLILKSVSNVSHAEILSLQPAQAFQASLELCSAAAKHKCLPTAEGHENIQGLLLSMSCLMGCDCNNLTCIPYEWYIYCYVSLDHSSSEAFSGYLI